jgi:S-adenosylmethionine decarboxylase
LNALGVHLLVELKDCNKALLNDIQEIGDILVSAAKEAKATIIESRFHQFNPFGISGVVIIAESHLTIHTWPEYGFAAVDIFTCGDQLIPTVAAAYVIEKLESKNPYIVEMKRGLLAWRGESLPHKAAEGGPLIHERDKEPQLVS